MLLNLLLWFSLLYNPNADIWTYHTDWDLKEKVYNTYKNEVQENWALRHLETGDIVCRRGNQYLLKVFNFSDYICDITRSKFSHCGIIVKTFERTWVIDLDSSGTRKIPFSLFLNEVYDKNIKVMRIKHECQSAVTPAAQFAHTQFERRVPFDFNFDLDSRAFYCSELAAKSFQASRIVLAEPVRVADLPGIYDQPFKNILVILGSRFYADKPFDFDKKLYTVESIIHSKYLEEVFEGEL